MSSKQKDTVEEAVENWLSEQGITTSTAVFKNDNGEVWIYGLKGKIVMPQELKELYLQL